MITIEYYITGDPQKHSRYFVSPVAARNFYKMLANDPNCKDIRVGN